MRLRFLSAAFTLVFPAAGVLVAQSPPQESISITHVTVVDVVSGKELPDRTVVIQSPRIVFIDPFDSANPPQGQVIDAHSGFLIPGLWDMHVHIHDLEDLPLYVANGVVGVRMMSGRKRRRICARNLPVLQSRPKLSLAARSSMAILPSGKAPSSSTSQMKRDALWTASKPAAPTS